ncbi:hypothetical protein AB0J52_09145 [Spirillospora sp. NPDC049652]
MTVVLVPADVTQDEDGAWNGRARLGPDDIVYGFGETREEACADLRAAIRDVFDHEGVPAGLLYGSEPDDR